MGFSAWIKRRIAGIFCVCVRCWAIKLHILSAILILTYKTLLPTVLLLLHNCIGCPGDSDSKESSHNGETTVWTLSWEDPLEKGMATHSSILAWKIPWTDELGRLQSMGSQRVGHDWGLTLTHCTGEESEDGIGWITDPSTPRTQMAKMEFPLLFPSSPSIPVISVCVLGGVGVGRWMETPMERNTSTRHFSAI